MERLSRKLRSERGASILLALLMFLVCAMVGATVLAAVASNAGKARSNRTEQQKFLNLSSAIQLVADEIQRADYTGKYLVHEWDVTTTTTTTVPDGPTTTTSKTERYFCCEQVEGEYSCGDLTDQLPFREKLDQIFGTQFKGGGYQALAVTGTDQYDLLVELVGDFPSDSAPKGYEVPKKVTVRVKLDENTHHILLTAWEGAGEFPKDPTDPTKPDLSETMQAELVAKITETVKQPDGTEVKKLVPGVLTVGYDPEGRQAGSLPMPPAGTTTTTVGDVTTTVTVTSSTRNQTAAGAPMKWELHWIRKGAVSP